MNFKQAWTLGHRWGREDRGSWWLNDAWLYDTGAVYGPWKPTAPYFNVQYFWEKKQFSKRTKSLLNNFRNCF